MDNKIKEFIAEHKLSDDQIFEFLSKSVEKPPTVEEEVEQEGDVATPEAEKEKQTAEKAPATKEEPDLKKMIADAVAEAMKGKPIPKPKPVKKDIMKNTEARGWGVIP